MDDVSREADYLELWPDTKSEVAVPIPIGGVVAAVINVAAKAGKYIHWTNYF